MAMLREYDLVRVVRLLKPEREFDGTEGVMRPPRIGDVATICHENERGNPAGSLVLEMVNDAGLTVWLADFEREELELVTRP